MAFTQIPQGHQRGALGMTNSPVIILLIMRRDPADRGHLYGCDAAILIFTPLFLPIVRTFGMHPVQFGLILVYNLTSETSRPRWAITLFVVIKVGKNLPGQGDAYMLMYYVSILVGLVLVTYIPAVSMALPTMAGLIK